MPEITRQHSWFGDEQSQKLHQQRLDNGLPLHVSPFSTLVAAMGPHWKPGCHDAVLAMCQATYDVGYQVAFYEQPDLCIRPLEGIGTMRNEALRKARREGWEYLLYVDNDVMPPPDALVSLLRRMVPVVLPLVRYSDGQEHGLTITKIEPSHGMALITSSVVSFVLFNVRALASFEAFWEDFIGAHEQYHFEKLYDRTGVRPFLDTDVIVEIVEPPHFPLENMKGR